MEELKQQITEYWSQRVESFSALRIKELEGEKHWLWMKEFERYLPQGKRLNILDIGTGTGFFAFLLSSMGHQVTGIDLTEDMIREAGRTSVMLDIPADFYVMDGEKPEFAPGSFDAIVTRNLTWTLPHLADAYQAWHEILKPGGVLINFDADYCREKENGELPPNHAHKDISTCLMQEYEILKEELRPMQKPRPQWDEELLKMAGFGSVFVDTGVWQRIYHDRDEFYNPTPIFTIAAYA